MIKKLNLRKSVAIILLIYSVTCFVSSIYMFCIGNVRNALLSLLFMLFSALLVIASNVLKFELTPIFSALVLLLALGGIAGTAYEMYVILPCFDNILHGLSGFLFASLGFALMKHFVGEEKNTKNFVGCIFLAVSLSLAIATLWELFEYFGSFLGFDMQEDQIITDFFSYLLSGSHSEVVSVEGIVKTVIYYGDGLSLTIDGYLDIGFYDTITDMLVCFIGSVVFVIITWIGYYKFPKILDLFIPNILKQNERNDLKKGDK